MRTLSAVFLCLVFVPAAADAGAELTLAGGFRRGEAAFPIEAVTSLPIVCGTTPCILAEARTEEGKPHATLILDVPITRRWMAEALLTRQDGDLRLRSRVVPLESLALETFEAETLQLGLLRQWGEGRVRPFAVGSLGATRFESTARAYERPLFPSIKSQPADADVLSGSVAAGLKAGLGSHVALRLEGRILWHDLPAHLGRTWRQKEGSLGLTYRW